MRKKRWNMAIIWGQDSALSSSLQTLCRIQQANWISYRKCRFTSNQTQITSLFAFSHGVSPKSLHFVQYYTTGTTMQIAKNNRRKSRYCGHDSLPTSPKNTPKPLTAPNSIACPYTVNLKDHY